MKAGLMSLIHELDLLKNYRKLHIDLSVNMMKVNNGDIFPLDLLLWSTSNRSMCLLKGFIELIESKNYICAVPLIRLQLDNGLRLFAGTLVKDPHEFSIRIMKGIPVNKQKDISNNLMTDKYLVQEISKKYPWISELYNHLSGYIHLSEKHYWNAIQVNKEKDGSFIMKISDVDSFVTEQDYIGAVLRFRKATDVIFDHISGWINCKENPIKPIERLLNK